MSRITKADLEAQVAELRAQVEELRTTNTDLLAQVAERDARIARGQDMLRAGKAENIALREQLAARRPIVINKVAPASTGPRTVVTRFYRGGQLIEKTRVGNRATERVVEEASA